MQRIALFLMGCLVVGQVICEINPKWEHPHAWGKIQKEQNLAYDTRKITEHSTAGDSESEVQENSCGNRIKYDVLEIYYLKLVNYLVSKDRFKIDPSSGNLKRHITIELSNEDIEQFTKIKNNVHAIDAKIFDILAKNNNGFIANSFDEVLSVYEKIELFISDKIPLEDIKFFILLIAFLAFVWQLSRFLKRNVIITFICVAFLISYAFDYMRCCQEKEIDKLLELQNASDNPCQIKKATGIQFIAELFGKSPQDECKQHLMGNKKYFHKEYCDIFDHFIDFLVYKNILKFVQKIIHIVKTISADTAFPYNIICVGVVLFFLKDLLIACLKSFVNNIFRSIFSENRAEHHGPAETGKIENKPSEPIHVTFNLNTKKKRKGNPKISNLVMKEIEFNESSKTEQSSSKIANPAPKALECNDRIEELTSDEAASSDDSDSISVKADKVIEEIKVIKSFN